MWLSLFCLVELSLYKAYHYCICLFSSKLTASLWVSTCTLIVCGGAGKVTKGNSYVLEISEDWVQEFLISFLMGFALFSWFSTVPKGTWVDLVDPYLLGMLRHSILVTVVTWRTVRQVTNTEIFSSLMKAITGVRQ